jgi:hypothetical protein
MGKISSWEADSPSTGWEIPRLFIEPKYSFACSQVPPVGPYFETYESSPYFAPYT